MTQEQRRTIERLYHEALARPRELREVFLAEACAGDEGLKLEVESLLAQDVSRLGPLDGLAIDLAAAFVNDSVPMVPAGRRIGFYEVIEPIGAGGMGQVYRARDTALARDVAIKIVPPAFAADPGYRARFEREARVLASLNHPHIAAIYGIEAYDELPALVLEFVDGETLAERIARGPLSISQSLDVARQICDALEAAHTRGVVHRDLKPANVKITPTGAVKVLDFGLAKVMEAEGDSSSGPSIMRSGSAVIVGTAAYMSPEQARGYAVDTRTDIWAFGCVLYEMLTGLTTFRASTLSDTLAAVLEREPSWHELPDQLPESIRRLLVRCLQKDADRRLRAIGDVRLDIEDVLRDAAVVQHLGVIRPTPPPSRRTVTLRSAAIVAGCLATGVAGFLLRSVVLRIEPAAVSRSFVATQPFDRRSAVTAGTTRTARPDRTAIAISPNGQMLVWRAQTDSGPKLYQRALDRLEAAVIEGTEGADSPFFSPDGQWLAFAANGQLKRILLAGRGPATTIGTIPNSDGEPILNARIVGGHWGEGDRIVFGNGRALWQVAGGAVQPLAKPGPGEFSYRLPQVLPGGEAILFTIVRTLFAWDDAQVVVRSLATGEQKVLLGGATDARYVPTGHLVFMRSGTMMAVPFDLPRLEVTGEPVALIEGVMHAVNAAAAGTDSGAGQVAIAADGTLVYVTGGIVPQPRRALLWMYRDGSSQRLPIPIDAYYSPRISPVDQRVAVFTSAFGTPRVWVVHPDGTRNAVTTAQERGTYGIWTRDGQHIVFSTGRRLDDIYQKRADGTGRAEPLYDGEYERMASSWSSDGKLAIVETHPETNDDIALLDVGGDQRRLTHILAASSRDLYRFPEFSPDGRWLAYVSNVSGRTEVYVQPYPGPGPAVPVSASGGAAPAWRADGRELFYVRPSLSGAEGDGGRTMVAVDVRGDGGANVFTTGPSRPLFTETPDRRFAMTIPTRNYDVAPDGTKFLMVQQLEPPPEPPANVVLVHNWFEELKRLVPSVK
jgi:eukaryotic-like serine/threonine-protein kinase